MGVYNIHRGLGLSTGQILCKIHIHNLPSEPSVRYRRLSKTPEGGAVQKSNGHQLLKTCRQQHHLPRLLPRLVTFRISFSWDPSIETGPLERKKTFDPAVPLHLFCRLHIPDIHTIKNWCNHQCGYRHGYRQPSSRSLKQRTLLYQACLHDWLGLRSYVRIRRINA